MNLKALSTEQLILLATTLEMGFEQSGQESKTGRVLSQANIDKVKGALSSLEAVLETLGKVLALAEPPDEDELEEGKADQPAPPTASLTLEALTIGLDQRIALAERELAAKQMNAGA